ncbi:hypothetical protein ColTof3_09008 [Colletotrichum tofieldiae]|nr:hypothetical protein ColTof3_09008 [Colletotrichum tofieldiae]
MAGAKCPEPTTHPDLSSHIINFFPAANDEPREPNSTMSDTTLRTLPYLDQFDSDGDAGAVTDGQGPTT